MHPATVAMLITLVACQPAGFLSLEKIKFVMVYHDAVTGDSVRANWLYSPAPITPGERGEPGDVNPAVIEYIVAAPEGPFARYYDLVLSLVNRPRVVDIELAALHDEAVKGLRTGDSPRGRDYARALGRRLARPIRDALRVRGGLYEGSASVHWGIPVDLDSGVPLLASESDDATQTYTTIFRYESAGLLIIHSSATQQMLAWDVSEVPGAFQWEAPLDQPALAARIVALHPLVP